MTDYAIGDVQGCFDSLQALLVKIAFDPDKDCLWFAGDLVNRGNQSLETLRFIKNLNTQQKTVLGNHDLHLLAVYYGVRNLHHKDTLKNILTAPDAPQLMDWLRKRPLLIFDTAYNIVMAHAGLAPAWSLAEAISYAKEIENELSSDHPEKILNVIFGNEPNYFQPHLPDEPRWRAIVNYFTRMRFCDENGHLDFSYKGTLAKKPAHLKPWFALPHQHGTVDLLFGHWAALEGKTHIPHFYALDTGCVWGNALTAMRLVDKKCFSVHCDCN